MNNKSCCSPAALLPASKSGTNSWNRFAVGALFACLAPLFPMNVLAGDAPAWMHAAATATVPPHDEKTDAVAVYAEDITVVLSEGKIKTIERRAYKILRPGGRDYGIVAAEFDSNRKITGMKAWCIPAQGKDYEVKQGEAVDASLAGVESSELVTDMKERFLRIPAAEPGNVVGYEIETEKRPFILQDRWSFQHRIPVKEARYTLQLPSGWEYKAIWINHAEIQPTPSGANQWQWVVTDVPAIREEDEMPPWRGVAGQMIVSLLPPGGSGKKGFENWNDMARWESGLSQGQRDPSPDIKQKVAALTARAPTTLAKMQAIAAFVQKDIRYVAIELGIGGWQPHPARDIYSNKFGDCKDKATLMSAMLKEIGVDSYYLDINTDRGGVTPATPPLMYWFNHEILGIRLPDSVTDPSLIAIYTHPKLGRILIFDPTSEVTPLGQLEGPLQDNYGLLVTEDGGDLIRLPQLDSSASGQRRTAKLKLTPEGTLSGDVTEVLRGDYAATQRYELRSATKDADRIKHLETLLSRSLGMFQITSARVGNLDVHDQPFEYIYSFQAINYAKSAGNLLLVRPRVVGNWSSDILEKKEPRKYPVEFRGPMKNTDAVEIKMPAGYEVDELPLAVDAEYSFGSYHSKCEVKDGALVYTRTLEVKELSVPVDKLDQLKKFYRIIASDERSTAVLKPKGS
jgi:Domain of Unknown Function with PDB structure (DUF3857)/Transglutaminase-like superfamily